MDIAIWRRLFYLGLCFVGTIFVYRIWYIRLLSSQSGDGLLLEYSASSYPQSEWFAPNQTVINNLSAVLGGSGVFGFVFDGSETPSTLPYGTYNFCNMPHVRRQEYIQAPDDYKLEYVEVIHRHHKRTPYAANTFPRESYIWNCDDEALSFYGAPRPDGNVAAINWQVYTSSVNPLSPKGFNGTCNYPQITAGGLNDSRQHGVDLFGVYHDMLNFLPDEFDRTKISFRVTNNQITSQVAGQVIFGMYPTSNHQATNVLVQHASIDSLEPRYACPAAAYLGSYYSVGSKNTEWLRHLKDYRTFKLFSKLDSVSGVKPSDLEWHIWVDHYFDNLSARLCHQKPLPCKIDDPTLCISQEDADMVFRIGEYEYSLISRDTPQLFHASRASYGIWVAELVANLRSVIDGKDKIIYRHNVAHDGSLARLLSILQVDVMVWPGLGSEMVFELYSKEEEWFLRVLWSGQAFTSSHPDLGRIDMLPVQTFLAYVDMLVGLEAKHVPELCKLHR